MRATGQRALVVAVRSDGHVLVEYIWDPADDPIDRDSVPTEDLVGIYHPDALELVS